MVRRSFEERAKARQGTKADDDDEQASRVQGVRQIVQRTEKVTSRTANNSQRETIT